MSIYVINDDKFGGLDTRLEIKNDKCVKLEICGLDFTEKFNEYLNNNEDFQQYLKIKDIVCKVTGSTDIHYNEEKKEIRIPIEDYMVFSFRGLCEALNTINVTPSDFRIRGVEGTSLIFLTFKIV